jgi:glutamine cyclotransferase
MKKNLFLATPAKQRLPWLTPWNATVKPGTMNHLLLLFITCCLQVALFTGCNNNPNPSQGDNTVTPPQTALINYAVTKFYPHDTSLYTEGLVFHDGQLFESTGSPEDRPLTHSVIGIIDLATGKMDKKIEIDRSKYFGEGIVIFNDKLYQLTYTNQVGFIYDIHSFRKIGEFSYANKQGWSLTTNGHELIMDDGTDKLTFLDPASLKAVRSLPVTENGLPVDKLNELEYIRGFIYANIWLTDFIVKIDPANGKVVGRLDFSSLAFEARNKHPAADVLNGIAYDSATDRIFVTGKLWPNIYQVDFPH